MQMPEIVMMRAVCRDEDAFREPGEVEMPSPPIESCRSGTLQPTLTSSYPRSTIPTTLAQAEYRSIDCLFLP